MLSGGKLFDEGMYGCIFTPPLDCEDKSKNPSSETSDTTLSKLILTPAANHEWTVMKKIQKIPLWKNYFIASESSPCIPASIQKDKDLNNCEVLKDHKLSNFRIINLPYGGVPLTTYRINLKSFDFMNFIIHFIEAGALLNLFGIVHRDIHQGNILIDQEQVPRIIDYNLSILVNGIINLSMLKHKYDYNLGQEPPDSTIVNAVQLGYNYQKVIDSIIQKKSIMKKIRNILGVSEITQMNDLETFYLKSKSLKTGDEVAWFNNYWTKIDSWAIAVNIVDILTKLMLWPEFSTTFKKISPKLIPVLRKMCEVDPRKRADCVQALNAISPNSFIIRKYAKPWLAKVGTGF
jgi:serine/threonine protein kinase